MSYPNPNTKWKPNYKFQIRSLVQVESRKGYIRNLRAAALFFEEEVTDEDFILIATGQKAMPRLDTYRIPELKELEK
jgi:hypothetical protein